MIQVKEFYDMRDYSKKKWISAAEQVNEFILKNNIGMIDAKYWINTYDNGDKITNILLIYKERSSENENKI